MSDIEAFLDIRGYHDPEAREILFHYITFLDDTWMLKYYNDPKRKKKQKAGQKKR